MPAWSLPFALLLMLLCACVHGQAPGRGAVPVTLASGAKLSELTREAMALLYEGDPCRATQDGLHAYDTALPDMSKAAIRRRVRAWDGLLAEMATVDARALDLDGQVDREALEELMQDQRFELAEHRSWQANPMSYIQAAGSCLDALMKRSFAPGPERVRSATARLRAIPALLTQGMANVESPPPEFVDLALRETSGSGPFFSGTLSAWARESVGADDALLAPFAAARSQAAQAVSRYQAWLESLKAHARGSFALGPELFLKKLRYAEGVALPLDVLLRRGEEQLERDHQAFLATARRIDPSKTPEEVEALVAGDHPSAAGLLPFVRTTLARTRDFVVSKGLATLPSMAMPTVEETPPYLRSGTFASMDAPGPYETRAREAFYYVTPVEPGWTAERKEEHLRFFNRPQLEIVTIHEAFPGHYLQLLYAPEYPTPVRKLVSANTNIEGWAHYAEQMMVDQGFGGGDPRVRLAQLSEALLRDCRYVAGVKMHTMGMSLDDATRLFVHRCFQQPSVAFEEARRGTYDPIYLYYTFGKLEIQDLARDYQARTGRPLRDFHDAFVRQGPLPVPLIRKLLLR